MGGKGKVRFGILGIASIARRMIGASMEHATIVAAASRDEHKARDFAARAGIPKAHGSYESLLADPEIDAVYIPLPHHLHCRYTVQAAESGKHVLVEKPAALNVVEIRRMQDACTRNGVLLMEGLMYRFRNTHLRARQLAHDGTIGRLRHLAFAWSHNIFNRGHAGFRLQKEHGGGCLTDLGIYGVDWIRFMTGAEPDLLSVCIERDGNGLDVFAHATFHIPGVVATLTCGYSTDANYYYISGEKGSIYAPVSLSGRVLPGVLHIHLLGSDKRYSEEFEAQNAYALEMDYFARRIQESEQPEPDAENAARNIELLHRIESLAIPVSPYA